MTGRVCPAALLLLAPLAAFAAPPLPLSAYPDLINRPLFTPSRRPPAPAAALSAGSLRLSGVVTEGGKTIALIRPDDQKVEVRVGLGAQLNGWQVAGIDGRGIDLVSGRQHLRVSIKQAIPPPGE